MLPSTVRYGNTVNGKFVLMDNVKYKYDSMGNICEIRENGNLVARYEYDAIGRLTREDNKSFNETTVFAYDNNGNIISKRIYAFTLKEKPLLDELSCTTVNYAYDAGSDRLMSYGSESFVYDVVGNPTTYRGKRAVWAYGRQLQSYNGNTYTYDARGRRLSKKHGTNTAITFTYDESGKLIQQSNGLEFIYDHTGICAVVYNGSTYFYRKNAQNDIIALLDKTGKVVVKYMYDAWGNNSVAILDTTATTIANLNPFRYRSYYLDTETNLYFLKTRYYDPEIGRFMTIDGVSYLNPDSINGLNMYAYCGNNPIMATDPNGTEWWNPFTGNWNEVARFIGGVALAALGVATMIITLLPALIIPGCGFLTQIGFSTMMYGAFMVGSVFDSQIYKDMVDIGGDPFNTDASLVVNSRKVSFYKGMPSAKVDNLPKDRSGSFLGIWLSKTVNENTVKHEWGHSIQQGIMGALRYGLFVGIPSYFHFGEHKWPRRTHYYVRPWEVVADYFGGADPSLRLGDAVWTEKDVELGIWHMIVATLFGPVSYLFAI